MRVFALFALGVLAFLCFLEAVLRVLPGPTATRIGYYVDPVILTYPPHHEWRNASGWDLRNARRMHSNNFGFVASKDFKFDQSAVALIGDSFVEGSALRENEALGPRLETRLVSRPVYVMGVPGASLLDHAERVRFAAEKFGVQDFVVIVERGDVKQSLCGRNEIPGPCLDAVTLLPRTEKREAPTRAREIIRESAAAQYLLGQLRLEPGRLLAAVTSTSKPAKAQTLGANPPTVAPRTDPSPFLEPVFDTFAKRVSAHASGRLVLVLDADRAALYDAKATGRPPRPDPDRRRLLELARQKGIDVVDLEPTFAEHIARSDLKLEVSPADSHWNAMAIDLVASAVAKKLASATR